MLGKNKTAPVSKQAKPPRYLVCVDKRLESKAALRLAAAKAAARGGTLAIIHVIPPSDFQTLQTVADRMQEELRAEAEALMQALADEAYESCGVTPVIMLREGPIGDEIIAAAAEDTEATMLVLGIAEDSSSRGQLAAWLASQLGSRLLIPLLMVPGNLTDRQLAGLI